ncbi:hypothetical protein GCM10023168_13940 [Fodinibacter luteus]|uniref:Uncharacterized protein n=1 Tax=Fodinibacter luteus TaxID=552064 RepID=A0ABP8K9T3_9MICO
MTATVTPPRSGAPPATVTAEAARALVLDLCDVAGDGEAVSALLLSLARDDTRQVAAVALTALHIVFLECLTEAVPTNREEASP